MKILLIVDDYLPDSIKIAAKMMHDLGLEFQSLGHQVTVVTPAADLLSDVECSLLDGINIWRFKSGPIKNVNKVKRAINESLLSFNAWRKLKNKFQTFKHDIIVYYSPSIFWGGLVERLKKVWHVPAYLILRDIFPQWAIDNGLLSANSPITLFFRCFEKKTYNVADVIGIQSPYNIKWFRKKHKDKYNIDLLYNWASAKIPKGPPFKLKEKLGIEDKVLYFYGGNIGHAQDMMNIMSLVNRMRDHKNAYFVLLGKGDEYNKVKNNIKEKSLKNITLLQPVSQLDFAQILKEVDVGLFSLHKNHKTHNFPGKLLGYMINSIPILGSVNSGNDVKDVIENAQAGLVSINGEDGLFLENATKLLDVKCREIFGVNSKILHKKLFSVDNAAKTILEKFV